MKKLAGLIACITVLMAFSVNAQAASTFKLNKTSLTIAVGESVNLSTSGGSGSVSWSSSEKTIASVSKGKVTGKSAGKAVITAKSGGESAICNVKVQSFRIGDSTKSLKVGEKLTLSIIGETGDKSIIWATTNKKVATVSNKGVVTAVSAGTAKISVQIGTTKITRTFTVTKAASTPSKSTSGSSNNSSSATAVTKDSTLKSVYEPIFGNVGVAVTYNQTWNNSKQLQNAEALAFIKKQYNSITIENEMKPDAILRSGSIIDISQAKNNSNYVIPSGYSENKVMSINFSAIDAILKVAKDNGLKVRFHTLIWTDQTPEAFFKENYSSSGNYVKSDVMDKRVELYVKTVVNYVHSGKYKDVVYAWDIVNEHVNKGGGEYVGTKVNPWYKVYGSTNSYVVQAFKYAHEALKACGMRDDVKLFYNDYNTYDIADRIVSLIKEINKNGKYCDGVGMQMHLGINYPSISKIGDAIDKFSKAGFEIQITELDMTVYSDSGKNQDDLAKKYGELFKMLVDKKKAGANITGITFWGLYDSVSWRASGSPLLFSDIDKAKPAYTAVLNAAN